MVLSSWIHNKPHFPNKHIISLTFMVYQQNKKEEKKNLQWRRRREHNEDEDGVRANEVYLLTINEVKLRMYKS